MLIKRRERANERRWATELAEWRRGGIADTDKAADGRSPDGARSAEGRRPSTVWPASKVSLPKATTCTSVTATIVEWRCRLPEPKMADVPK
mmetsp:Transcript_24942/g.56866  ORF Transcript_24942/g.56866 Transcript_24942/m.56866 type:complete len:91 (-) Transcript_24942:673-945(-)